MRNSGWWRKDPHHAYRVELYMARHRVDVRWRFVRHVAQIAANLELIRLITILRSVVIDRLRINVTKRASEEQVEILERVTSDASSAIENEL